MFASLWHFVVCVCVFFYCYFLFFSFELVRRGFFFLWVCTVEFLEDIRWEIFPSVVADIGSLLDRFFFSRHFAFWKKCVICRFSFLCARVDHRKL